MRGSTARPRGRPGWKEARRSRRCRRARSSACRRTARRARSSGSGRSGGSWGGLQSSFGVETAANAETHRSKLADVASSPTTALLGAARGGDEDAFARLIAPYRDELHPHCSRMLASGHDAEDALQDALLRAWRGLARFEGRSSLRSWLYTIATNACLNLI